MNLHGGDTLWRCMCSDARRAFMGGGFWLCILLTMLSQLLPISKELGIPADVMYYYRLSAETGSMQWLMPCIAAIAYAQAFFTDTHTRFSRMLLLRCSRRVYIFSKLVICQATACCAVMLGMFLFLCYLSIGRTFMEYRNNAVSLQWALSSFGELLTQGRPYLFVFAQITLRGMGAALWATASLAVSAYIPNRFMILLSPVILYYAWEHLDAFIASHFVQGYPGVRYLELGITHFMQPTQALVNSAGVLVPLTLMWSLVFAIGAQRRLCHG